MPGAVGPSPGPPAPETPSEGGDRRKKRDKVRSAWISFAGRIVAQIVGAAATVTLTLAVLDRVQFGPAGPAGSEARGKGGDGDGQPVAAPADAIPAGARAGAAPSEVVLAVLPFADFSSHSGQDAFAEAMTEALIAALAQVPGVQVVSRTSAMQFRDPREPLPAIGRQLGVTHVIEGSVVRGARQVRVTAQLIDAATDRHVWARTFDRASGDPLAIQADVAEAIAVQVTSVIGTNDTVTGETSLPAATRTR